jgi:hypothetical protein
VAEIKKGNLELTIELNKKFGPFIEKLEHLKRVSDGSNENTVLPYYLIN